jgi:hypothetical protein
MTPCCGLEVQNPTQELKLVKGTGNTFDSSPKWNKTLLFFGTFLWVIYSPQSKFVLKARPIPLISTPSGKQCCRPSAIFHGIFIGSPQNPNIKVDI